MNSYKMEKRKIARESPVPLYLQLKGIIKEQVEKGILEQDSLIPSERKLCEIFDISHITVRQALVELTKENFLFRVPGRGTFVKGRDRICNVLASES